MSTHTISRSDVFLKFAALIFALLVPSGLFAQRISGVVQDPSSALIAGAHIEISGGSLTQPLALSSDGNGKFASPDLKPGTYTIKISREGFQTVEKIVDVRESIQLELTLAIAEQKTTVSVGAKGAYANSDPFYQQLRNVGLGESFRVENFTLNTDVATFHFTNGTITLLHPVDDVITGAVFVGEGHLTLKPATPLDVRELSRRIGSEQVDEDFTDVVFRFTRQIRGNFHFDEKGRTDTPPEAASAFSHWRDRMRTRSEQPISQIEALLHGEDMDNVDADVLAAIYNPAHPVFFNAYIHGKKHKDLRFFIRARVGALPQLDSPEEVALVNYDPGGMEEGVWYLSHLKAEYERHTTSSLEDRRLFATRHYKIETVIAKNGHLFSIATITVEPLIAGERVLKFGLLPNLRVSRVSDDQGRDLHYVQESRKEDGSFYAILREAPVPGQETSITVEYAGDQVLEKAGEGSYYVRARTSWYPNLNGFGEKATYDLTFKVPKKYRIISIGNLEKESIENDLAVTHWVTPIPVAVAGFNYGEYEKLDLLDPNTGYKISGYYLSELPDNLRHYQALQSLAPKGMTRYALEQTRAQLQVCTFYFGKSPYDQVYITEQPNFNFGQSWPDLVYLPISAYTDSTQRYMLFGGINNRFTGFVQEVTPHEVAHQWWGHTVGWASYHDQWLSEGFAEFSAGLFLQQGVAGNWQKDYIDFWERQRQKVLEKSNFGISANDSGPLWMGMRLNAPKTQNAYFDVTYPKGAYVLQMLRSMMWDPQDQDKAFIAMMHDFVESHRDKPATTESFKAIVEKHMNKSMDVTRDGRMDWFFNEWVYGTEVPKYKFQYQLSPAEDRKVKLHISLTESDVDDHFAMLVPVFADFGNGLVRLGQFGIAGNTTRELDVMLPSQPKKVVFNAYKDILER